MENRRILFSVCYCSMGWPLSLQGNVPILYRDILRLCRSACFFMERPSRVLCKWTRRWFSSSISLCKLIYMEWISSVANISSRLEYSFTPYTHLLPFVVVAKDNHWVGCSWKDWRFIIVSQWRRFQLIVSSETFLLSTPLRFWIPGNVKLLLLKPPTSIFLNYVTAQVVNVY